VETGRRALLLEWNPDQSGIAVPCPAKVHQSVEITGLHLLSKILVPRPKSSETIIAVMLRLGHVTLARGFEYLLRQGAAEDAVNHDVDRDNVINLTLSLRRRFTEGGSTSGSPPYIAMFP
jgi:hypothetical protein